MTDGTIYILAIESSCDDTSVSISANNRILVNKVAGQDIHMKYGGVVPELASRAHQQNIVPLIDIALKESGIDKSQLNAIAFTAGPGLLGSLLVGVSFAKSFALALNIPLIAVNHMEAHILAHFIDDPKPPFPFLCLTVSGGHTLITQMDDYFQGTIIGQTIDDAAGEAFDKAAKMLGLPYPGGPLIDKYAKDGNPLRFNFANPRIPGYDFSFSGIKTSILYFLRDQTKNDAEFIQKNLPDICASIQFTIVRHLIQKLQAAVNDFGIKHVAVAGGVSANSGLRKTLQEFGIKNNTEIYIPAFEYCTDNAAMIAISAYYKFLKGEFTNQHVVPFANLHQ